jgi:hypothetical protein
VLPVNIPKARNAEEQCPITLPNSNQSTDETGCIKTSIDGYCSYCSIIVGCSKGIHLGISYQN